MQLIITIGALFFGLGIFFFYTNISFFRGSSSFLAYRMLRGIICIAYLILMLVFQKKEPNFLLAYFLLFYGVSSLMTIWYENNFLATLSMGINAFSFFFLIIAIFPKIRKMKIDSFVILSSVIMLLFNGFLVYQFLNMFKEMTQSSIHFIFIVLSTFGIVFVSFLAILYNHKYSTNNSVLFSSFIFILLFAEVFRGIAYYDIAYGDFSAHFARFLLIVSLSFLTNYCFKTKNDDELLNTRLF